MEIKAVQKKHKPMVSPGKRSRRQLNERQSINVQSILHGVRIQPKLRVGQPNDKYEQEADRVAEQVMRMPAPQSFSSVSSSALTDSAKPGTVQRACDACSKNKELIQSKTTGGVTPEVTPAIGAGIQLLQGGGQPLSKSERSFFEPRIGADFSNVRVHNSVQAANVARSVNARAFTHGNNVVFGAGEYAPNTSSGKELLAHELTHVVQQSQSVQTQIQRRILGVAGACWFENCESQLQNFFMIPEDGPPGFHPSGSGSSFRVDDIDGLWFKFHTPKNEWFKIPDIGTGWVTCTDNEEEPSISSPVLPFATASWTNVGIHTPNPF